MGKLTRTQYETLYEVHKRILRLLDDANEILGDAGIDSDGDTMMAIDDALDNYEDNDE